MDQLLKKIRTALNANVDESTKKSSQRFFKEEIKYYGVKTGIVGTIAKQYWKEAMVLGKKDIFALCEELYRSDYCEEAYIVSYWIPNLIDVLEISDLALFKRWIERYINNWAKCDGFCNHTMGSFIERFPETLTEIKKWTQSENRWLKRACAVSLIIPAKKGRFLTDVFDIADQLLLDKDDMVQKGYGWLLKEASRLHRKEVFDYVVRNKRTMPRTALRYAIELMPKELKKEAMARS